MHSGAMVALIPADGDAQRLAVDGGEPADELHCTLMFLGPADDIDSDTRQAITDAVRAAVTGIPVMPVDGFALSLFNPHGPEPCTTLGLSGPGLADTHQTVNTAVAGVPGFTPPPQHTPWHAHLTLAYTDDHSTAQQLVDRAGPVTFDRVRVAFAGEHTDIPLAGAEQARSPRMPEPAARTAPGSIHLRRLAGRVAHTSARFVEHAARHNLTVADLPTARLPWYATRNLDSPGHSGSGPVPTVFIFDEIGGSFGIDANELIHELQGITADTIHVRINSPGGAVFDAINIASALRHHPAKVVCFVDALAASAASIIAVAGDEMVMMPGAQLMIHEASATLDGNAADMTRMATFLNRQSENVAHLYRMKGGGDLSFWRNLMAAETWMFADECVQMGLADRTDMPPKHDPMPDHDDDEMAALMGRSHELYLSSRYRYPGRAAAPAPPTRHRDPVDDDGLGDATTRLLRRLGNLP